MARRRKLYAADMAELGGIKVPSFRRERCRPGVVPEPDGYDEGSPSPRPFWYASTARRWVNNRRPKGYPKDAWKAAYDDLDAEREPAPF